MVDAATAIARKVKPDGSLYTTWRDWRGGCGRAIGDGVALQVCVVQVLQQVQEGGPVGDGESEGGSGAVFN